MYKVISGGGPGFEETKPTTQVPDQSEEGWGGFLARNLAKAPSNIYAGLKSGVGLGDLEHILRTELGGDPEEWPNYVTGMPTFAEAKGESRALYPQGWKEYGTESKPQDWLMDLLTTQGPMIAATGGLSSLSALGKTAAILGGSKLGGMGGQTLGGMAGIPKTGEAIGGLLGGAGAGLGASLGKKLIPSKGLAPEILLEDLRTQQKSNYDQAIALEGDKTGNAGNLLNTLNKVNQEIEVGMPQNEQNLIRQLLSGIEGAVTDGKMTLAQAKMAKRNINSQLYEHTVTNPVKQQLVKISKSLGDFIEENGSPEHNKFWNEAQKNTKDINKLEEQIRYATKNKESLPGVLREGLKKYKFPVGLSVLADVFGFGHKAAAITGYLTNGARRLFSEGQYLYRVAQEHPAMYDKYMDTIKQAAKLDAPKVAIRINDIAKSLDRYYPETEEEPESSTGFKVIYGGQS